MPIRIEIKLKKLEFINSLSPYITTKCQVIKLSAEQFLRSGRRTQIYIATKTSDDIELSVNTEI